MRQTRPAEYDEFPASTRDTTRTLFKSLLYAVMQQGTHDPATGLPFTSETKPARDLSVGAPEVTQRELSAIFPDLLGPEVEVVDD